MADMTREEFERMQNDAIRRVKNMQQRASSRIPPMPDYVRPLRGAIAEKTPATPPHEPNFVPTHSAQIPHEQNHVPAHSAQIPHESNHVPAPPAKPAPPKPLSGGLGFLDKLNLKSFEMDPDRALVLMMMALLGKETADETLMLALLYIML